MAMKTRILKEIEFNEPGMTLEGRLLSMTTIRYKDGGTNIDYLARRTDGVIVAFKGSSMLNKLLYRDDAGKQVVITYRGPDGSPVAEGMSPRKIFDVQVDDESKLDLSQSKPGKQLADGTEITDADLPF